MPLDAVCLTALLRELAPELEGARLDKAQQPERDLLLLSVYTRSGARRLLISAGVGSARLHFTRELWEELKGMGGQVAEVLLHVGESGLKNRVELDLTLARGLNYYTGAIFEVKALGVEIGSISGGGRYDNLTGIFGLPGVSGVGFSFGCKAVRTVRRAGIDAELYPDCAKMKKQMAYANANNIPYVGIIGDDELAAGKVTLKDMMSGEQRMLSVDEIISVLAN